MTSKFTNQIVERLSQAKKCVTSCQDSIKICTICQKRVNKNQKAIVCSHCKHEVHIKCNDISPSSYESLDNESLNVWNCLACTVFINSEMFPFTLVTDEILLGTNVTDLPSIVDSLPTLEILSKLQNLPNLSDYDIDKNIKLDINCNYYNVQEIHSLETSTKDLSLLHMNIRILSLHLLS